MLHDLTGIPLFILLALTAIGFVSVVVSVGLLLTAIYRDWRSDHERWDIAVSGD